MEELSIEQKAQRYDDALERMKSWVRGEHPECFTEAQKAAEFIFQELAESDDKFEKHNGGIEDKPNGGIVLEDCSEGDGFYKVNLAYLSKEQVEEIENIVKKWNPELESEDEKIRKNLVEFLDELSHLGKNTNFDRWSKADCADWINWLEKQGERPQGKSALEAAKEEKVDNQNCVNNADKDEAKFQVGDWIISIVNRSVYHVLNIKDNKYQLDYLEGTYWYDKKYVDDVCRLWDIKDAKDGDILADEYSIILFRKIGNLAFDNVIDFHVGLNLLENRIVKRNGIRHYGYIDDTEFKPATKEQRKMFLQRIHGDGYVI